MNQQHNTLKILIAGLGFAGNQYINAIRAFQSECKCLKKINIAYHDKQQKETKLPFFSSIQLALKEYKPNLIIVTVNDENHAEILNELSTYKGFVICEKPLANKHDDLKNIRKNLSNITGFCFDLIERYSPITRQLKTYVTQHQLELVRAHFNWGKNRINDYRPTCGVTSEVIHALDLIQHVSFNSADYVLGKAFGTRSDFSISGPEVPDSVLLIATLGKAVITGYSSFVHIIRRREISLTFHDKFGQLVYAQLTFDTPEWDQDTLVIWKTIEQGDEIILDLKTEKKNYPKGIIAIDKLVSLVGDTIQYLTINKQPQQLFPNLEEAINLQRFLNIIETEIFNQNTDQNLIRYFQEEERKNLIAISNYEKLA